MVSKYGFFSEQAYIPSTAALVKRKGVKKQSQDTATRSFRPISGHHTGKVMAVCETDETAGYIGSAAIATR